MDIAIVGGGLAGLTAAHDLVRAGLRVVLFDDQPEAGGQVRTRRDRGFVIEEGAEGFVAADTAVPALCRDLGIADQIVPQLERSALLLENKTLTELSSRDAANLLGIPVDESGPRGVSTLRNGMGSLAEALVESLSGKAELLVGHAVSSIARNDGRWRVTASNGTTRDATHLVLAIPPRAAAALLGPHDPEAATLLSSIILMSNVSVSLAYRRADVGHPLAASGLVIAPGELNSGGLRACAFCSSKFADRAPPGAVLLRAFYRPDAAEVGAPDREWVRRATETLGPVLDISANPQGAGVSRWPDAIPQYSEGHAKTMSLIALRIDNLAGLNLVGAAYHPGGVPGAVRSGRALAQRLAQSLRA